MKIIKLTKDKEALVDDSWFDSLSQWNWHYDGKYARRNIRVDGKLIHIYMHKVVAGIDGMVDHNDLNKLNNQSYNLRQVTTQLNATNTRKKPGHSSIYKGVSKCSKGWRSQIWFNNKRHFDATFPNERWAAMAYDLNAAALFCEYARLNFSEDAVAGALSE